MKLTARDRELLEKAARVYGVRPATMAQLLVNRGVRAVLDNDRPPSGSSDAGAD